MTDLLPCPFCGGELTLTKHFKYDLYNAVHRCTVIPPIAFELREKERIVSAWNTRALTPEGDGK